MRVSRPMMAILMMVLTVSGFMTALREQCPNMNMLVVVWGFCNGR